MAEALRLVVFGVMAGERTSVVYLGDVLELLPSLDVVGVLLVRVLRKVEIFILIVAALVGVFVGLEIGD